MFGCVPLEIRGIIIKIRSIKPVEYVVIQNPNMNIVSPELIPAVWKFITR